MQRLIHVISVLILIYFLQGCVDVATSGAQAIYNRHAIQKNLSDQYITMQANQNINHMSKDFKDANIAVATYNGEVLLAGQVPYQWQKEKAEQIVKAIPKVKQIYNLLTISNPSSMLVRVSDAWITTKVKSKLIASNDLDATQIKVVTENGTVYLMGILPPEQAVAAADIASNTQGVLKVVKIFSYITISKKLSTANVSERITTVTTG